MRRARVQWLTPVVIEASELSAIQAPMLVVARDHDPIPLEQTRAK